MCGTRTDSSEEVIYFKCSNNMHLGCTVSWAELQFCHCTSLRTMLLSCWSRRKLSNVPHRPPLMFWQLAHSAWHPLGTEDRAAPKPKLANLTWHERGDENLGRCWRQDREMGKERCCRCINIHRLKVRNLQKTWMLQMSRVTYSMYSNIKSEFGRANWHLNWWWQRQSTLSREPLRLTCAGTYFWRQTENLVRLAVMCFFLSVSSCATLMGFMLSLKSRI